MKIKQAIAFICALSLIISISSCEKDEGKLPNISFKSGPTYTNSDVTLTAGSNITIGINASKSEKRDVLKKFDISKSINSGSSISIFNKSLSSSEEDDFSYDFTTTTDTTSGQQTKYIFSVTNRDGLTNQVALTITTQ